MSDIKAIAELFAALLTPVIAIVTTVILINQWRLQKQQWRLELFEKRYAVFRATSDYISSIMRNGTATTSAQAAFLEGTRDRALFFDDEINSLLDEIWKQSIDLETHQSIFRDLGVGEERTRLVNAAAKIKKEMPELGRRAHELFGKYLRLTNR